MSSTIAKLYSTMMEQKVSAWDESENKQALGQAGFRPKHSTVNHLVTLRLLLKKVDYKERHSIVALLISKNHLIPYHGAWE